MRGGDAGQKRLSGDDAAHEGSPRFDDDAVLPAELGDFPIAEIGVELDLVDGRHGVGALDERFEVVLLEVRHADRPGAPVGRELFEDLPRRQEIPAVLVGQGPVDEEEVDVVGAQELQRGGEGLSRGGGFVIRIVELGGQEDVLARNPRRGDRLADLRLVPVHLGRVDVPASFGQGELDDARSVLAAQLVCAQAELRNRVAGVQWDIRNAWKSHGSILLFFLIMGK